MSPGRGMAGSPQRGSSGAGMVSDNPNRAAGIPWKAYQATLGSGEMPNAFQTEDET